MQKCTIDVLKSSDLTIKIVESLPYFVYITDEEGNIIYINNKGNMTLEQLKIPVIKNGYDFLYNYNGCLEDDVKINEQDFPLYKSLKNKEEVKNLIVKFNISSEDLYFSISSFPLLEGERVIGAVVTLRDVTEDYLYKIKNERQKFLELSTELKAKCDIIEILRSREKEHLMHLKDVINNISEGIMVFDKNRRMSLCNKSVFDILNLRAIDIVNKNKIFEKYEVIPIEQEETDCAKILKHYIKSKSPMKNAIFKLIERTTLQTKYIEINSAPIINKNDELLHTILTIKDVTEIKLHQINAEVQAEFISDVVNTVSVPIAVVDYPNTTYRLTNKKYEEVIGKNQVLEEENEYGKQIKYINEGLYKIINNVGENYKSYTVSPYRVKNHKGEERFYKIKFIPCKNKDNTTRIHIHGSDITEEVNHNIELEKITRLKDEFFTIISHELRTPLTIIYSSLQLAYDIYGKEITPNMDKTLSRINQNCSRLLKLINNILDISKAEAGFLSLSTTEFDIVYVSEAIVNSANSYATSKGIELIFDTNEEECNVKLDRDKYEKVLLNLLSNAIKFTPEGKQIIVSLVIEEEYFYLNVKDYGVGIPEDKTEAIFDRFAQVDSSLSRRAEGTGIGLALVKKIVELMDGEIKVISEVGKGTEFIVKIKKVGADSSNINSYAILSENIDRINIEFSDIN
ncbi:ATP-binding protein [Clostridium sp. A1-XYC3]|uniref:histidine kinase n=1 Tax=Clostridium tanneri TaxID=3037988 RepID=A0ABU4JNJ9_9CLOT|nr:ATP-binding protein [Clostridium sp. A1-XYC3]MDW8799727.1 ATP-binding protein [Clostridium sp. A1-XYC3]